MKVVRVARLSAFCAAAGVVILSALSSAVTPAFALAAVVRTCIAAA